MTRSAQALAHASPSRPRAAVTWVALCALCVGLVACGGGSSAVTSLAPVPRATAAPTISTQPSNQNATPGQTATFSVTAAGATPLTYQWSKNGTVVAGATAASYTTPVTAAADNQSDFSVTVSNAVGSVASSAATLTVTATAAVVGTSVLTYKNDASRTGLNSTETTLTLANVTPTSFGLLRTLAVDGRVDAQPLYVSQALVGTAHHNVVVVATEHDSVYAFDADSGAALWHVSLLKSAETPSDTHGCNQVSPEIGVTSTPVIDRGAGSNGILYLVAMSKDTTSTYHQRLHALDLSSGAELLGGPTEIAATFPTAGGGTTTFNPGQYEERAALLLANATIYTSWTSHCDIAPYTGWIIGFAADTLARASVLNVAPNSGAGPAIWMSGGGPAVDAAGYIYLLTANGAFETTLDASRFPNKQDYGNSFLKLSTSGGALAVADYFAMSNEVSESSTDRDLGSGGVMLLPDLTDSAGVVRHLMVGAGKDGNIYVVSRDSLGKYTAGSNAIWQQLTAALPGGIWSTPAYFNDTVYYGDVGATLKAFAISGARLGTMPRSQSATQFGYPGTAPSVSASGTNNAIVWAHENANPAVLHAYDAGNLALELYNSNQAANNRDHFGAGNKYITPTVADGKVFVGTMTAVAVFGLLPAH